MSDDRYTEVSEQSWFGRLGSSIKGVFIGLLLFLAAFPLLFWNEGRSVERIQALEEGVGSVISIATSEVDPANNGKLVHASGLVTSKELLRDPIFGHEENEALELARYVEMFQWRETTSSKKEKELGGSEKTMTSYSYDKAWSTNLEDSSNFKQPQGRSNPSTMPFSSEVMEAKQVDFGVFQLSGSLRSKISGAREVAYNGTIPESLANYHPQKSGGSLYFGKDPSNPAVGDMRVTFEAIPPSVVTIVAMQQGNNLYAYNTSAGSEINLLEMGEKNSALMFQIAQDNNKVLTWGLRLGGLLLMCFGVGMILNPLSVFADVVPIIGDVIGAGVVFVSVLVSVTFSVFTIAIAWVLFRPLIAAVLFVVGVLAFLGLSRKIGGARKQQA
jgi:hypothetical protein